MDETQVYFGLLIGRHTSVVVATSHLLHVVGKPGGCRQCKEPSREFSVRYVTTCSAGMFPPQTPPQARDDFVN